MFHFKHFSLYHDNSTLKIGTDSVLLAASVPLFSAHHVLDIGCGCGIIAYSLAYRLSAYKTEQKFVGIDIDAASVAEAKQNIELFPHYQGQQFIFKQSPLQEFARQSSKQFDLIVSNPPYFGASLKPEREDRLLSKHRDDTLSFHDLAVNANQLLADDGEFFLILPPVEYEEFHQKTLGLWHRHFVMEIQPTPTKPANRIIAGYGRSERTEQRSSLIIRDKDNQFSEAYKELTGEFYLK